MRNAKLGALALSLAVAGLTASSHAAVDYFYDWTDMNTGNGTNFAPSLALTDSNVAQVNASLLSAQSLGKPLAVKVRGNLSQSTINSIFNNSKYTVQYVFADLEGQTGPAAAAAQNLTAEIAATKSKNAFVGNFNFYPNASVDTTNPGNVQSTATAGIKRPHQDSEYTTAKLTMANEELYPGAPDYRNPVNGNSNAPTVRAALFTLPIQRLTLVSNSLRNRGPNGNYIGANGDLAYYAPASAPNIPWVTRFNNFGNAGLDSDHNSANGYAYVQNNPVKSAGQLPSRGDYEAQILHYRLRGASSVNLFNASISDSSGVYTQTQQELDTNSGWYANNTIQSIFTGKSGYAFANLSNVVKDGVSGQLVSTEKEGAVWSGVFSNALDSNYKKDGNFTTSGGKTLPGYVPGARLAVLMSNLDASGHSIRLDNVGGYVTYDQTNKGTDNYTVDAGGHRLLTFTFAQLKAGKYVWQLDGNSAIFNSAALTDRTGVGTPEPGSLSLLGLGAVGFLARRRRAAAKV